MDPNQVTFPPIVSTSSSPQDQSLPPLPNLPVTGQPLNSYAPEAVDLGANILEPLPPLSQTSSPPPDLPPLPSTTDLILPPLPSTNSQGPTTNDSLVPPPPPVNIVIPEEESLVTTPLVPDTTSNAQASPSETNQPPVENEQPLSPLYENPDTVHLIK